MPNDNNENQGLCYVAGDRGFVKLTHGSYSYEVLQTYNTNSYYVLVKFTTTKLDEGSKTPVSKDFYANIPKDGGHGNNLQWYLPSLKRHIVRFDKTHNTHIIECLDIGVEIEIRPVIFSAESINKSAKYFELIWKFISDELKKGIL